MQEVITLSQKVTGHSIPTTETGRRPGDSAVLVAGLGKIKPALGWYPRYEHLETIIETAWQRHQREARRD